VVDGNGQIYFVDLIRHRIMKLDSRGALTTLAQGEEGKKLSLPHHLVLDQEGNVYSVGDRDGTVWRIGPKGTTDQIYPEPGWIGIGLIGSGGSPFTRDRAGNLYCINYRHEKHSQVLKICPDGRLSRLAGGDWGYVDGKGAQARFRDLHGASLVCTEDGSLLVTDNGTLVRQIAPDGLVTTLAGAAVEGFADGGGTKARFKGAAGLAIDAHGNIYVADSGNHRIRRIARDGTVSTLGGSGLAGGQDGPALEARFHTPVGVAVDRDGNVCVLDYHDKARSVSVRRITPNSKVATLVIIK
jgi:sugar lactone lactonase YvrE